MAHLLLAGVPERYLIDGVEQTERVLGRGAYGVVFEGQWRGTKVAIKRHYFVLVRDENGQLSSPYRRFLEEFPVLKELPHPNIVQVFGMVPPTFPQDTPGLVMEYLCQTLRKRYAESPQLSRLDEATVSLGVVSALDYLHSRNVVHRDLTTNNIMVCDAAGIGGQVKAKITDIGGAAMMADGAQVESMSLNPGAQIYMAPETQRRSRHVGQARYGKPADCYSCALSVMAMCIHREPPDIFTLLEEGRARDLESLGEDHPLQSIIVRCLKVDPTLRPTALQLCGEIAEVHLHLKNNPADRTTSAAFRSNRAIGRPAENPDVVSARAENAQLRQAMAALNGQRDDLMRERDSLLTERDELLAGRDRLATENADLQRDLRNAATQRDELMGELLAEQERLAVENARLRQEGDALQQDVPRDQQAESRQQLSRASQHASVLEFLATQTDDTGMLARCSLVLPPNVDGGKLTTRTVPKWAAVGEIPACGYLDSVLCVWRNRLFIAIASDSTAVKAFSSPLENLSKDSWMGIDLPPESTTRGDFVDQSFFSHRGTLYLFSSASDATLPQIIWRRHGTVRRWERVARIPQHRLNYSLSVVDDCLVVAGGSRPSGRHVRAQPDVISLSLVEDGADWVAWPPWPPSSSTQARLFPCIAAVAGEVHIIGGELHGDSPAAVLTAHLSTPPEGRVWSTDAIPPPPKSQCAGVVANDHLVVCCGQSRFGRSSKSYMYSAVSKTWLPLPEVAAKHTVGTPGPILVSTDHGILMVSQHGIAGLRW